MRLPLILSGLLLVSLTARADVASDEAILRGAKVGVDGPGLLEFFRSRVVQNEADETKLTSLIERLSSGRFKEREKAHLDLIAVGPPARPFLAQAAKHKDAEVRKRVGEILSAIESATSPEIELAALRLLLVRKPNGSSKVLLTYLPSVRDTTIEEEALGALLTLGVKEGKADEDVEAALKDKLPMRRALAALLMAHSGNKEQKEQVIKLLKSETESLVRLRAGQGIVAAKDKTGVAVLLPLLSDAPLPIAEQARDMLSLLAIEKAPATELKGDPETRKKVRDEWERWWDGASGKIDLAKVEIDLPWLGTGNQARAVVLQFIKAIETRNVDLLKKTMDAPFSISGALVLETREQLEQLFIQAIQQAPPEKTKTEFGIIRVIETKQYISQAQEQMKTFLNKFQPSEVRVVMVSAKNKETKRDESAYLIVRLKGGKAHIVGVEEANRQRKN